MTPDSLRQRFGIVGHAPKLDQAIEVAMKIAPTEVTVLVLGENGTGKDVFSRIIHQLSARKHKPFIAINCGAIPEGTIDSELFGHEKGAFTSAYEARKGYFEEANGGVIFLDEIGELPLATQSRLLRVLENGEYLRVGSSKVQKTDVRIVAATNRNLLEAIRRGRFREDLYFRLNTVTIHVPPLRERGTDLELLFRYFAQEFAQRYGKRPLELSPAALDLLYRYRWPGNIRELRNFVEKLTVLAWDSQLSEAEIRQHLPLAEHQLPITSPFGPGSGYGDGDGFGGGRGNGLGAGSIPSEVWYEFMQRVSQDLTDIKRVLATVLQGVAPGGTGFSRAPHGNPGGYTPAQGYAQPSGLALPPATDQADWYPNVVDQPSAPSQPDMGWRTHANKPAHDTRPLDEPLSIELKEKDLIKRALRKYSGNRKKAAVELGISERTLYRKIKSYELDHL